MLFIVVFKSLQRDGHVHRRNQLEGLDEDFGHAVMVELRNRKKHAVGRYPRIAILQQPNERCWNHLC